MQLPHLDAWAAHRAQVAAWYADAGLGAHVTLPRRDAGRARRLAPVRRAHAGARRAGRAPACAPGIGSRGYYRVPVHRQPVGVARGWSGAELPGTDEAARTHLAMPISAALTRAQVDEVVGAVAAAC